MRASKEPPKAAPPESYYRQVHSDFIIHWTGRDIDRDLGWTSDDDVRCKPQLFREVTTRYVERLRSILRFGLWMTEQEEPILTATSHEAQSPFLATCFTELKLSEVRAHAHKYGRLGIGFKRFFVVERGGLPVWYYPPWVEHFLKSPGGNAERGALSVVGAYLKPMGVPGGLHVSYEYYDESEWRILHSGKLEAEHHVHRSEDVPGFTEYFESLPRPKSGVEPRFPKYLLWVTGRWLAIVVYPNIHTRYEAQEDEEIQKRLVQAKNADPHCPQHKPIGSEHPGFYEWFVRPLELELDNCLSF